MRVERIELQPAVESVSGDDLSKGNDGFSHRRQQRRRYFSSTISKTTLRLLRNAAALTSVRIDLAVRPCLPIILPRSSLATLSSSTEASSFSFSVTSTASGWVTKDFAKN